MSCTKGCLKNTVHEFYRKMKTLRVLNIHIPQNLSPKRLPEKYFKI
ncbi:hypothetical protein [Simonsiella muelleri]|nr:hypothetical protein [Simonsiella muelleri]